MIFSSHNGDRGIVYLDGEVQMDCYQCDVKESIVWRYKRNGKGNLIYSFEGDDLQGLEVEIIEGKEVIFIPVAKRAGKITI